MCPSDLGNIHFARLPPPVQEDQQWVNHAITSPEHEEWFWYKRHAGISCHLFCILLEAAVVDRPGDKHLAWSHRTKRYCGDKGCAWPEA